jgi:tight adherence protein C
LLISAIILIFLTVSCLVYYYGVPWAERSDRVRTRLERLKSMAASEKMATETDLDRPLFIRLFGPLIAKVSGIVEQYTPVNIYNQAEALLESAGHPWNLKAKDYLAVKTMAFLGFPFLVHLIFGTADLHLGLLITGNAILLAVVTPDFIIKRLAASRKGKIMAALPDNLDLLTVSVEAGLGFDQALSKLVEKTKGPLTEEFKRVLQEIRIGKTRRDALREMSVRAGVEDLKIFVAAIIQADLLGVSIGNVLRIQSRQLRERRRLKAEERAQKAPVKMLFPMIVFIFPSLFIILLGPGVLQLIDNFAKLK